MMLGRRASFRAMWIAGLSLVAIVAALEKLGAMHVEYTFGNVASMAFLILGSSAVGYFFAGALAGECLCKLEPCSHCDEGSSWHIKV